MGRGKATRIRGVAHVGAKGDQAMALKRSNMPELRPGTRVRLRAPAAPLDLTADTGTVVGPAEWDYYYVIQLDGPAHYRHADGRVEIIDQVREAVDNLDIIELR